MSQVIDISDKIKEIIQALKVEGKKSEELIQAKAITASDYDKNVGIQILTLKDQGTQATLIPQLAKANVSEFLLKKTVAEESLKAHYSRMETLKAQLNGYQSIFRHLEKA